MATKKPLRATKGGKMSLKKSQNHKWGTTQNCKRSSSSLAGKKIKKKKKKKNT